MKYTAVIILIAGLFIAPIDVAPKQALASSTQTASFDEAVRAFYAGDTKLALRNFLKLAHKGNPQAQYFLAYMYDMGQGTGKDIHEAARWYLESARQGYLPAEVYAGYIYAEGHGVRKNLDTAIEWYRKAASKGDDIAQNNLGNLLQQKEGADAKYTAARWFLSAAMQGNSNAQYNLADMYRTGEYIQKDLGEAAHWYHLAAMQGNKDAQNALAYMHQNGLGVAQSNQKAVEWYQRAAEQDLVSAQFNLARLYDRMASETDVDDKTRESYHSSAAIWYYHAASAGNAEAAYRLATAYRKGAGVPKDINASVKWLEFALKKNYAPAKLELARYYETGIGGVKKDPQQALNWYLDSANQGNGYAMFQAARMYYKGTGIPVDLVKAYKWFVLAVENLDPEGDARDEAIIARVEVSNNLSSEQLAEARRLISQWEPRPSN